MIKMIAGVFGLQVKQPNGQIRVVGMGPDSGPFSASPEVEARLVAEKRAVYVTAPKDPDADDEQQGADDNGNDEQQGTGAPIGFDETPPEDMTDESSDDDEESSDTADEPDEDEGDTPAFEEMTAKELREIGVSYGLTFKANASKSSMIEAIRAKIAELDDDMEDAPAYDASEAVQ